MDGMTSTAPSPVMDDLIAAMAAAVASLEAYGEDAKASMKARLAPDGKPDRKLLDVHQHAAHGLSWAITYVETLREVGHWAERLDAEGKFGEVEQLLAQILFSEYCAQLIGGIPMNQGEIIRPADLGVTQDGMKRLFDPAVQRFLTEGKTTDAMAAAAKHLPDALGRATVEETGLDETLSMIRDQFRRYAEDR
ncbi:MAG: acyl-CoA dehydrogenase, partial [Henriciella sp.]